MNSAYQSYLCKTNCAVVGCSSTAQHDRLFRFPRQKQRYREWAEFSLNPELRNVTDKRAYMCYKHFSKNQFRDEEPLTLVYNASPSYHSVSVAGTKKRDTLSSDESDDSDLEENYRSFLHKIEHSYCVQDIKEIIKDDCASPSPVLVDLSMDCDDVTTMKKPQVTGDKPFTMKDITHSLKQLREEKRRIKAMKRLSVTQLMSINIWPHENIKPFIQLTSDVAIQTNDTFQAKIALETLKNLSQEYLTVREPEIVKDERKENLCTLENENTISPTNFLSEDAQSLDTVASQVPRLAETPVNSFNVQNNSSSNVETHSFPIKITSALVADNTQSPTTALQQPSGALLAEDEVILIEPKPEGNPVSFSELPPATQTNKSNPNARPRRTIKLKTYERTQNKFKNNAFLTRIKSILSNSSSQNNWNKESPSTRNTGLNNRGEPLKINVEPREHPFSALPSLLTHTNESLKPKESLSSEDIETEPLQNQQIDKNCHQITIQKLIDSNLKTFTHSSKPKTILKMKDEGGSNQEHKTIDSTMKTVYHSSKPETIVSMSDEVEVNQEHKTVDSTMKTVYHSSKPEIIVRMIDGVENNQGQHNTKDSNGTSVQEIIDSPPIRKLCCYPELHIFAINDKTKEQQKGLKTVELNCDKKNIVITNGELNIPEEEQTLITQSHFQKIFASNFKRVCNNHKKEITISDTPERANISEKMYCIFKQNAKMMNVEMESPRKTPKVETNEKSPLVTFHIDPVISRHTESINCLPTISQTASKEGGVTNSGETTVTQSPLSKVDSVNTHSQETKPSSAIKLIDLTVDDHLSPPNHFDKPSSVDPKIVDVLFADSLQRSLKQAYLSNGFQNSPEHLKITQSIVENVKNHDTLQPVVKSPVKTYRLQQKRKARKIQSQCSKKKLISYGVIKQHCSKLLKSKAISITNEGPQSYMFDQNIDLFDQLSCKEPNSLDVRHTLPQEQSPSNAGPPRPHDVQHTLPKNQSTCNKSNMFDVQSPAPHDVQSTLRQDHFSCKMSTISSSPPTLSKDTSQLVVSNKPVRKQIDPSFITYFKEHFNSVKRQPGKYKQSNCPKTAPSEFKHCLEARLSLPFEIDQKARENVLEVKQYNPQNIEVELKTASDPPANKKASVSSVKPSQNEATNCVQYNKSSPSNQFVKSPTKRLKSNSSFSLRGFALKFTKNSSPLSEPCEFTNEIQSVDKCCTLDSRDNLTAPRTCEQNQSIEVKDNDMQIIDEHIPNKVQKLGTEDNQTKELQCLTRKHKTNQVCTKVQVVPAVIQQVLKSDNGKSFINYLTNIQPMVSLDRSVTTFEQAVIKHIESLENSENNKPSVNSGCVNRQVFLNYGEQNLKLIGVSSEDLMEMDSSNPWVIKLESGWII